MKRSTPQLLVAALSMMLAAHAVVATTDTWAVARETHVSATGFQKKRPARRKPARRAGRGAAASSPVKARPEPVQGGAKTVTAEKKGEASVPRGEAVTGDPSTLGMTPEQALAVAIREALRKPREGETRARGVLTMIECGPRNAAIFNVRVGAETIKLDGGDLGGVHFMAFTPRETGSEIGCGPRKFDSPVVVTYRARDGGGDLVAVEFVPASFTLER